MAKTAKAFAPAKINLTLHVTGQRDDGYHLLDSLVVFADVGDRISVRPGGEFSLAVKGLYSGCIPAAQSNLVWKAAEWFGTPPVEITLHKELPPSSGIGGGSSDAAAVIRALSEAFDVPLPEAKDTAALGADVPVCMEPRPTRMQGIGDILTPAPALPPLHIVLANPMREVSTPEVFQKLPSKRNPPMSESFPEWRDTAEFAAWLSEQRNDLEDPARSICPAVGVTLARIQDTDGCLIARMSGSGATCFGLYETSVQADTARDKISQQHPDWWVVACAS